MVLCTAAPLFHLATIKPNGSQNIHSRNVIQTEEVIAGDVYVYAVTKNKKKEPMNLKENEEGSM